MNPRHNSEKNSFANEAGSPDFDNLLASFLAASGDLKGAENLLCRNNSLPSTAAGLDLLARIAVQHGDIGRASNLWNEVLKIEPFNVDARKALKRLNGSWLTVGVIRRIGWLVFLASVLSLAAMGVFSLLGIFPFTRPGGKSEVLHPMPRPVVLIGITNSLSSNIGNSRLALVSDHMNVREPGKNAAIREKDQVSFCNIKVPSCTVTAESYGSRIVFNEGLFRVRDEFENSAHDRLMVVSDILRREVSNYWIIVDGQTDSDPIPANSVFHDNIALGMRRAFVTAEVLRTDGGISEKILFVTASGELNQPFSCVDEESKKKNRTVILRILPCAGLGKAQTPNAIAP